MSGITAAAQVAGSVSRERLAGRLDIRFSSSCARYVVFASFATLAVVVVAYNVDSGWRAWPLGAMVMALGYLSAVDVAEHRLPNQVVLPMIGLSYLVILADGLVGDSTLSASVAHGVVGLTVAAALLILRFGMGDVKLVAAIGAVASWLGPEALSWTVLVASISGALAALVFMVAYRRVRLDFGFGPFLALGSTAGMIAAGF